MTQKYQEDRLKLISEKMLQQENLWKDDERVQPALTKAIIMFVVAIIVMFTMLFIFIKSSKRSKNLEKRINGILKDGKDWKVLVTEGLDPNAFCIIYNYIFVTKGLLKLLTEREVNAVMLHEAGHINNKDGFRRLGSQGALIAALVSAALALPATPAITAIYMIFLSMQQAGLAYVIMNRILGRKQELKADAFAVRYGYGNEMVSALKKLQNYSDKERAKQKCGSFCRALHKVSEIMDEHPPVKERVEKVLKEKETWEASTHKSFKASKDFFMKKFRIKKDK
jgi:Zn-dependent protease with chaperone function